APTGLRVLAGDVGGSFGMKGAAGREDGLVLWAARRLGRPGLWASGRTEAFLSDEHGRDLRAKATLALDEQGRYLALDVEFRANIGAYLSRRSLGMVNNIGGLAGVYRIPAIRAGVTGVFTHTASVAPYRGAGRPEATYVVERLLDAAARRLGRDPADLRRRNLIPAEAMPYQTALTFRYDCGDFAAVQARAEALADRAGFAARRNAAAARGRLRGLGIASPIEIAGRPMGPSRADTARVSVAADGTIELRPGAMSVGQGHETALARLVADRLSVPEAAIAYRQGDTDLLATGRGNGGSSALVVGGTAVHAAIEALIEKGRAIAAEALEAAIADVSFRDGRFAVAGTDLTLTLAEAAARAGPDGFAADAWHAPEEPTYPNGCHICEIEIDPETGAVAIVAYAAVEDVGTVLDPALVEGQMQGGIAQGMGQALGERIVYDRATGQLISGSFLDYRMPIAADMGRPVLETLAVPTAVNPLGAKGVGEAGTVGALAAVMNAVCDALAPFGIEHLDMPATPERVWRAIRDARQRGEARSTDRREDRR
ncbi:MAG: molybdopterin-dependent oxidoreductase, partial [Inquilinus sp.]|nr:molybdopterin-dependent oxidoreductase [Inquilinus sp.]